MIKSINTFDVRTNLHLSGIDLSFLRNEKLILFFLTFLLPKWLNPKAIWSPMKQSKVGKLKVKEMGAEWQVHIEIQTTN